MAETVLLKARIASMAMSEPITSAENLASATWTDLPLTLRDDEVSIVDNDPDEDEVFSHENDTAEDYDVIGKGTKMKGSFIKVDIDDLVVLLGGAKVGEKFHRSGSRALINKAFKLTLKDGSTIIAPNAKGMIQTSLSVGYGGRQKYPFSFNLQAGSKEWNVDLIW